MSGVVSFFWSDEGHAQYARTPRDEIRIVGVRRNMIRIGLSCQPGEVVVPFDGGDDVEDDEAVEPWTDDMPATRWGPGAPTRSYSHLEWCDKMFEALTQSVDTDCTFRWVNGTWEFTEGRPA